MTVSVKDIRVKIDPQLLSAYVPKRGIDCKIMPYKRDENIYDIRFQTSDLSSVPEERCTMDDINKEMERFKIVADRMRDSPLYVKSFDKHKVGFTFEMDKDDHALDSIDEVRKNAKNVTVEADVPRKSTQLRWMDK